MQPTYDVVVVGSGTAGQTAAYELKSKGLSVGLVDNADRPGGVCALAGCQAKKWFYEATELVARSGHLMGKGVDRPVSANWGDLLKQKNKFTSNVPDGTLSGLKEAGIDFIKGTASFTNDRTIEVNGKALASDYFVLATGAVPMSLPIDGSDFLIKSDNFLELPMLPQKIIFVGGGFISFEFSHFATHLGHGNTHCTILEAAERPLGPFDAEMVQLLMDTSSKDGIDIYCNVQIKAIAKSANGFQVTTATGKVLEADLVVHGAGRAPNIEALSLENAGIEYSTKGILVDSSMLTSNARVYAVGDCAATIQLARVADFEAHIATANILGKKKGVSSAETVEYSFVPAVLFTYPQYAMVGATEAQLTQKGIAYQKSFAKHLTWPTYRRVGMTGAAYKILAGDSGEILGAHIISDNATGLINSFCLAMRNHITAKELHHQSIMTPYPSRESDIIYMLSRL